MWSSRFSRSEDMGCDIMKGDMKNIITVIKSISLRLSKSDKKEEKEEKGIVIRMRWDKIRSCKESGKIEQKVAKDLNSMKHRKKR